jgi:hypothetical protein
MSTTFVDAVQRAPRLDAPTTPSRGRRAAVAAAGVAACALPVVFTISTVGQLVTGTESEHRFHQLTGQGLLLTVLWLGGLAPLVRAGWRGRAPSVASVCLALSVGVAGVGVGVAAPGHGGLALAVIAAVTSAVLYAVLPVRTSLRSSENRLRGADPVAAVVTVGLAVLAAFFVGDQVDLQNHSGNEHAEMAHYFDMAWVSVIPVLLAVAATVLPAARRLLLVAAVAVAYVGLMRWAITPDVTWSVAAMAVGVAGSAVAVVRRPRR